MNLELQIMLNALIKLNVQEPKVYGMLVQGMLNCCYIVYIGPLTYQQPRRS